MYALDTKLVLPPTSNRKALDSAIKNHVIATVMHSGPSYLAAFEKENNRIFASLLTAMRPLMGASPELEAPARLVASA